VFLEPGCDWSHAPSTSLYPATDCPFKITFRYLLSAEDPHFQAQER
jgi:hypothetical protein